jgi:hypothetical protein
VRALESDTGTSRFLLSLISRRRRGERQQRRRERDECNAKCALKRRSARGTILFVFHGRLGIGSSIPESPKTFSEKTFPRISATGFRGSAETCQLYFQAIYKSKIERIPLNGLSRVAKPLKRLRVLIGM